MTLTWIYTLINIAVSFSMILEIMCTEYYCTKATEWRDAIETCFASGGSPVSYKNMIDNTTGLRLKQSTTVWSGDFIRIETITGDIPKEAADFECGYMKFTTKSDDLYYAQDGIQYTNCASRKQFFCEIRGSTALLFMRKRFWKYANSACNENETLWAGSTFKTVDNYEGVELWVRSVRIYTHVSINGSEDIQNASLANCGTNKNFVTREEKNNCDGPLETVCAFETAIVDPMFSRSCFEDIPSSTEAPRASTSENTVSLENATSTSQHNNGTFNEGTDQPGESQTVVIVTSVLAAVALCAVIGMLLVFLFKRRSRKHLQESSSDTSYMNGHISSIDVRHPSEPSDKRTVDNVYYNVADSEVEYTNTANVDDVYYETFGNGEVQGNGKHEHGYTNTRTIQRLNPRHLKPYEKQHFDDYTDTYVAINEYPPIFDSKDKRHDTNGLINSITNSTSFASSSDAVSEVSEYDTTRNVKRVQNTNNIYDHLHCGENDAVYDNKYTKQTKHSALPTDNMYSTTSVRECTNNLLQNTEPMYDVGMSNSVRHMRVPTDNVYSTMSMQDGGNSNKSLKSIDSMYDIGIVQNNKHFQAHTDNLYSTTSMK